MYMKKKINQRDIIREEKIKETKTKLVKKVTMKNGETYIYKRANQEKMEKEEWINRFLEKHPEIKKPDIKQVEEKGYYMEYIEKAKYPLEKKHLPKVIDTLVHIHSLPIECVPTNFEKRYQNPIEMIKSYAEMNEKLFSIFKKLDKDLLYKGIQKIFNEKEFFTELPEVFSHGDFHIQNVLYSEGRYVVIDWERVCVCSCYWDLFNYIDMTNPSFETNKTKTEREEILKLYYNKKGVKQISFQRFLFEYYYFALIYSMRFLILIEDDKVKGNFPLKQLVRQSEDTIHVIKDSYQHMDAY